MMAKRKWSSITRYVGLKVDKKGKNIFIRTGPKGYGKGFGSIMRKVK